jgi:hypothetical protein
MKTEQTPDLNENQSGNDVPSDIPNIGEPQQTKRAEIFIEPTSMNAPFVMPNSAFVMPSAAFTMPRKPSNEQKCAICNLEVPVYETCGCLHVCASCAVLSAKHNNGICVGCDTPLLASGGAAAPSRGSIAISVVLGYIKFWMFAMLCGTLATMGKFDLRPYTTADDPWRSVLVICGVAYWCTLFVIRFNVARVLIDLFADERDEGTNADQFSDNLRQYMGAVPIQLNKQTPVSDYIAAVIGRVDDKVAASRILSLFRGERMMLVLRILAAHAIGCAALSEYSSERKIIAPQFATFVTGSLALVAARLLLRALIRIADKMYVMCDENGILSVSVRSNIHIRDVDGRPINEPVIGKKEEYTAIKKEEPISLHKRNIFHRMFPPTPPEPIFTRTIPSTLSANGTILPMTVPCFAED